MHASRLFTPPSLGVAVLGAGISAIAIVGVGVAALAAAHAGFSLGIGLVLVAYGAVVLLGAWLGYRRNPWARGLIVAPGLLHIAIAASLLGSDDGPQVAGAAALLVLQLVTVAAAVLPATREALHEGSRPA